MVRIAGEAAAGRPEAGRSVWLYHQPCGAAAAGDPWALTEDLQRFC